MCCRKRSGELWTAKAKHRDPQVCFSALQAEKTAGSEPTSFKGSIQQQTICRRKWTGPSCGCRVLQLPEGNCCSKALKTNHLCIYYLFFLTYTLQMCNNIYLGTVECIFRNKPTSWVLQIERSPYFSTNGLWSCGCALSCGSRCIIIIIITTTTITACYYKLIVLI